MPAKPQVKSNGHAQPQPTTNGHSAEPPMFSRGGVDMGEVAFSQFVNNAVLMQRRLLDRMLEENHDIDKECGYPEVIEPTDYRYLYDREGIAEKVVKVWPRESWKVDPEVYETEEADDTDFEVALEALDDRLGLWAYLQRVDELSGIGHFGALLLGFDDGKSLDQPVEGVEKYLSEHWKKNPSKKLPKPARKTEKTPNPTENATPDVTPPDATPAEVQAKSTAPTGGSRSLLFVRAFDESLVTVSEQEWRLDHFRYGQPTYYLLQLQDPAMPLMGGAGSGVSTVRVHWTRVLHVADNRMSSEVYGVPRMRPVFNRLVDLRRLYGGSAEMFWKGAFPGYVFEANPDITDASMDPEDVKAQVFRYSNGLQRYFAMMGVSVKGLSPQVADPTAHINGELQAISIALDIPQRILMGSERGELASSQDARAWNDRVMRRQAKYLTPYMIRPLIDRLMGAGVLPQIEKYYVEWPDLNTLSETEKADLAGKITTALSTYVKDQVEQLVPPMEFFTGVLGMETDEADAWIKAASKQIEDEQTQTGKSMPPPPDPNAPPPGFPPGGGGGGNNPFAKGPPGVNPAAKAPPGAKPAAKLTPEEILGNAAGPPKSTNPAKLSSRPVEETPQQKRAKRLAGRRSSAAAKRARSRARTMDRYKRGQGGKFASTDSRSQTPNDPGTPETPAQHAARVQKLRDTLAEAKKLVESGDKTQLAAARKLAVQAQSDMRIGGMEQPQIQRVLKTVFGAKGLALLAKAKAPTQNQAAFDELRASLMDSLILNGMDPDEAEATANGFASAASRRWYFANLGKHSAADKATGGGVSAKEDGKYIDQKYQGAATFNARSFSSTQVDLTGTVGDAMLSLADEIPDADLTGNGRETEPHVTLLYGLHAIQPDAVAEILKDEPPIRLTLGKISIFPANELQAQRGGEQYDVVKVDVTSDDLMRLNDKLAGALPHTNTHPTYQPHATLAYVKPGMGRKYVGNDALEGEEFIADRVTFSPAEGSKTVIHLRKA